MGSTETTQIHENDDVNDGPEAHHHRLGSNADDAAAGNHTHSTLPIDGTSLPTASAKLAGQLYYVAGATGIADTLSVCLKATGGTFSWKTIATG